MKKKLYLVIITLALALLVNLLAYKQEITKAAGGAFGLNSDVRAPEGIALTISTSTLNFLTPGTGTTTVLVNTQGTEQIDINIFMQASSTLTDLRWRVEFSHSTTTNDASALWYPEVANLTADNSATTTNQVRTAREYRLLFASTTPHRIGTSTAVSSTFDPNTVGVRTFRIKDVAARWTKIEFYIPTGSVTNSAANPILCCTSLGDPPASTSTNAGINVVTVRKEPL